MPLPTDPASDAELLAQGRRGNAEAFAVFYRRHERRGTTLLVTWQDNSRSARAFVTSHGVTMPVLTDNRGLLARDYDVHGLPETFVIDPQGRVVAISRERATQPFLDDAIARAEQPVSPFASPRQWGARFRPAPRRGAAPR